MDPEGRRESVGWLEEYLQRARVLHLGNEIEEGVHKGKRRLVLDGGVLAIAKPEDGHPEGTRIVQSERAAWIIARELGWADLVAATVIRDFPSSKAESVKHSVQVWWVHTVPDGYYMGIESDDLVRAGVFDAIVGQTDRGGHNWLVLEWEFGAPRLKLPDNGFCFSPPGRHFQSVFYDINKGVEIPAGVLDALKRLIDTKESWLGELREVFLGMSGPGIDTVARIEKLVEMGELSLGES